MKKYKNFFKSILIYTFLFTLLIGFICIIFKQNGKNFIWQVDGASQHTFTLYSFHQTLLEFFKTGHFNTFTWNIGSGLDLFSNYAYYIFGDIFAYLSIFFSKTNIFKAYSILVIIRWYFVGIAFLCYTEYKKYNSFASIIGALMYTFSVFALFSFIRHPYFANAVAIFPLLMLGTEKIIKEDKHLFYTIIVAFMYISSFYFAYMASIIIAIYGLALIICTYKKDGIKKVISKLLEILGYSILGVLISSFVLLPTGYSFLNSERSFNSIIYPYSIHYYRNLFKTLLSSQENMYWLYIGVQSIVMISIPLFIKKRKENYPIFVLLIALILPILISQIGSIFCGFSYPNNRFSYVFTFIFAIITTMLLNSNETVKKEDILNISIFVSLYLFTFLIFDLPFSKDVIVQLATFTILFVLIINKNSLSKKFKKINLFNLLLLTVFTIGIGLNILYKYDTIGEGYVGNYLDNSEIYKKIKTSNNTIDDFDRAVKFLKEYDKDFYKISKYPYSFDNVSLYYDINTIGEYYSILPKYMQQLSMDLSNSQYHVSHDIRDLDYRAKITSLLGIKYIITKNDHMTPYGYTKINEYDGKAKIFINNNFVNFATLYNNYITYEEYEKLSPLEKEDSLINQVVLNKGDIDKTLNHSEYKSDTIKEAKYKIIDRNNIKNDNSVYVKSTKNNYIELELDGVENKEVYISIKGLKFTPKTNKQLIDDYLESNYGKPPYTKYQLNVAKEKNKLIENNYFYELHAHYNKVNKYYFEYDIRSAYYNHYDEILLNFGYVKKNDQNLKITFETPGTYTYDDIKIYTVSMNNYEEKIKDLNATNFKIINQKNDKIEAKVDINKSGILQFQTYYDKGWKVYVDGKETDTLLANKYFLGIKINEGTHTIKLLHKTTYLKEGIIISIVSTLILIVVTIYKRHIKLN